MKKLTAKRARKLSEASFNVITTLEEFEENLGTYILLGFSNMNIDIFPTISEKLVKDLKKRGFRVYTKERDTHIELEVEW